MSRTRSWLVAALAMLLGGLVTIGWGEFVWHRTGDFQNPLPPGQAWTQKDGSTLRITKWELTQTLLDEDKKPTRATEGTTWVHAHVAVTGRKEGTLCHLYLAGRAAERWDEPELKPILPLHSYCSDDDPENLELELAFLVPDAKLAEVRGLAVDHSMMIRQPPILTPPA